MLISSSQGGSGGGGNTAAPANPATAQTDETTTLDHLAASTMHTVSGSLTAGPTGQDDTVQISLTHNGFIVPVEGASNNEGHLMRASDGYPQAFSFTFESPVDVTGLQMRILSATSVWVVTHTVEADSQASPPPPVDYSLPENAEQIGVAPQDLQYPVLPLIGVGLGDESSVFEDFSIAQKIVWFAQRIWNEGNYVVEMRTDMGIIANDFNNNQATRDRGAVNEVFIQQVGSLGAIETLRGYANWILGVIDGNSTSNWDGWWGGWLSIVEWWNDIVPENRKSSLVDPNLAFS